MNQLTADEAERIFDLAYGPDGAFMAKNEHPYSGMVGNAANGNAQMIDVRKHFGKYWAEKAAEVSGKIFRPNEGLIKASTLGGLASGTQDVTLVPVFPDPGIIDETYRKQPVNAMIPAVPNRGNKADYNQLTERGGGNWKAEDSALADDTDTYARGSKTIRYLYSTGRVTGPLYQASLAYLGQAGGPGNMMNQEVKVKTQSLLMEEENTIITGNSSSDVNQPDGINTLITTNSETVSAAISIAEIRELSRLCKTAGDSSTLSGDIPNLGITCNNVQNDIKALLDPYTHTNVPIATFPFGMTGITFDGEFPIIASRYLQAASGSRRMNVINTAYWQKRVLLPATYMPLANTNDSEKFTIKTYETLITTFEAANAEGVSIT